MTPEEQNLDMLVAELDRENRLLRARNERLEREAEQRKHRVELTKNESVSYEELEIDRDRMKIARDSGMLEIANLKVENHDLRTRNERLEKTIAGVVTRLEDAVKGNSMPPKTVLEFIVSHSH
jgi:hypothetical protein